MKSVYFVCDESGSMDASDGINAINSALQELLGLSDVILQILRRLL